MKKIVLLIVGLLIYSCTSEDDINTYNFSLKNSSNEPFILEIIDTENNTIESLTILPNHSYNCIYSSEVNSAFFGCDENTYSYRITFDNNKGYMCNILNDSSLCFQSKNPLVFNDDNFNILINNSYEFEITQEDYENAHELP